MRAPSWAIEFYRACLKFLAWKNQETPGKHDYALTAVLRHADMTATIDVYAYMRGRRDFEPHRVKKFGRGERSICDVAVFPRTLQNTEG